MIDITIPEFDLIIRHHETDCIPKGKSGVYIFYDKNYKPLYTGKTDDLRSRIRTHFKGNTNTSGTIHYYFDHVRIFYESCPAKRDIYETFIINKLKTSWNKTKCFTFESLGVGYKNQPKKPENWQGDYAFRCRYILDDDNRCKRRVHKNGLCWQHRNETNNLHRLTDAQLELPINVIS